MSDYGITAADLAGRLTSKFLAQLTDDTAGTTVNEAVVTRAVLDAEAEFHSFASVYYVTPIRADSPDFTIARKTIIDLAAWNLLMRRPGVLARSDIGETERHQHDATLAWLRALSSKSRTVQLSASTEHVAPQPRSGGATVISDPPQFDDLSAL